MSRLAQSARIMAAADRDARWKPSLRLAAIRALNARVQGHANAQEAVDAFREQLFIETGISVDLAVLLRSEGVLP